MRIISYNSRGINTQLRPTLTSVLDDCNGDIICLQETWITKQDLGLLNTVHSDFHGTGRSTTDTRDGPVTGHPPGGVAILWKSTLDASIDVLDFGHDWLCGISIESQTKNFVIICVYMPCHLNTAEREDLYLSNLGTLHSVIEDLHTSTVFVIGDWNADISCDDHSYGSLLRSFCMDQNLNLSSQRLLPSNTFTYISAAWDTTSWLDHCIASHDAHNSIQDMSVLYHLGTFDHLPLCIDISLSCLPSVTPENNNFSPKLDWSRLSTRVIQSYTEKTDILLSQIVIPHETVSCTDPSCTSFIHLQELQVFYKSIVEALQHASDTTLCSEVSCAFTSQPGWSDYVADYYNASREAFLVWVANGKPKHGYQFDTMKIARARFKYALRFVKRNEQSLKCDAIAKKFSSTNPQSFWKEIKKLNSSKLPLPNSVDGVSGGPEIALMWKNHFSELFNCVNDCDAKPTYLCEPSSTISVSTAEIQKAICSLGNNKATGMDNISAEHLKYCSRRVVVLLAICFTGFLTHGFMPNDMISILLIPLVKDKNAKLAAKSNYRPIALASVLSKVIENVILDRILLFLGTECNQFGFKPKLGTEMPIYLLKEIIDRYKLLNGNIFMCFLDASKAFDRVNHCLLFRKLIDRGIPHYIVRFLDFWYSNQTMCVKWSGHLSDTFTVSNGVRQGGILSPFLFNVYVDELSKLLNSCYTGCIVGEKTINHVMYADDLVVFSPCESGLTDLLRICENFGISHDILYNSKKSAILLFKNQALNCLKDKRYLFTLNNDVIPIVGKVKYLGHYLCDNYKDDEDLKRQCRMLYAQANLLKHRFHMCTVPVKLKLFKTFCYSIYTSSVWWNYNLYAIKKVRIAYNDALRMMLNVPRYSSASLLFVTHRIHTFDALVRHLLARFIRRLDICSNTLVNAICRSDLRWCSRIRRFWRRLLSPPLNMP